jgi:hypothetical protein
MPPSHWPSGCGPNSHAALVTAPLCGRRPQRNVPEPGATFRTLAARLLKPSKRPSRNCVEGSLDEHVAGRTVRIEPLDVSRRLPLILTPLDLTIRPQEMKDTASVVLFGDYFFIMSCDSTSLSTLASTKRYAQLSCRTRNRVQFLRVRRYCEERKLAASSLYWSCSCRLFNRSPENTRPPPLADLLRLGVRTFLSFSQFVAPINARIALRR